MKLARIRSQRIGLHSDFIDINSVRKQQELEEIEKRIGAFNKGSRSVINNNPYLNLSARGPPSSPRTRAKQESHKAKEQENYTAYVKDRG